MQFADHQTGYKTSEVKVKSQLPPAEEEKQSSSKDQGQAQQKKDLLDNLKKLNEENKPFEAPLEARVPQ